ncbi:hypothetical protein BaRGS_00034126 [Batillaria attramentaria]|uniref:Apple domain-containing protein n=1 Tax=Batillaria attramentaria TaxID=370345 RepID=A0ABD0JJK9_9CAEN
MMPTCSFCLVSLLLATTTLTCSGAYDVTNTDELWKKVERLTDTSDTLNDQLHNLTRDVSEHTRRLDDMAGSMFPKTYACSHRSMLPRVEVPLGRLIFLQADVHTGPAMFPRTYVPTGRQHFHRLMFPQTYVPTGRCSHRLMFPQVDVPTTCSHRSMFPHTSCVLFHACAFEKVPVLTGSVVVLCVLRPMEPDSPATLPVREAWLSALEALVTRLVDNTDAMDSVRAQVQTLTTDTQNMEQQLLDMRAQGDNLTLEIQRRTVCSYTDLQPTFIKYPDCVISGYNMLSFPSSLEECLSRCAANPRCRTVDYPQAGGTCYLQPVTALDVNMASEWQTASSTYDNYQRTCL